MRIAFFTDGYLPNIDGVITSMQSYKKALEGLGHEVFIVAPKKYGYKEDRNNVIWQLLVDYLLFIAIVI